jgi:hypothetical protein
MARLVLLGEVSTMTKEPPLTDGAPFEEGSFEFLRVRFALSKSSPAPWWHGDSRTWILLVDFASWETLGLK